MRKNSILFIVIVSMIFTACGDMNGYKKTKNGVYYRFEHHNTNAQQAQEDDVLIGIVTLRLDKTVIKSSAGLIDYILNENHWYTEHLHKAILMMHSGDSAIFALERDSLKELAFYMPSIYKASNGRKLYCEIRLQDIVSRAELPKKLFSSKENIQKYLDGMTWTSTRGSKGWCRLHFENGKAFFYFVYNPDDKSWGTPWYTLPYRIEENWRNGEKRNIITCYDGRVCVISFDPVSGALGTLMGGELLDYGDFNW